MLLDGIDAEANEDGQTDAILIVLSDKATTLEDALVASGVIELAAGAILNDDSLPVNETLVKSD